VKYIGNHLSQDIAINSGPTAGDSETKTLLDVVSEPQAKFDWRSKLTAANIGAWIIATVVISFVFSSLFAYYWKRWNESHAPFGYGYFVPPSVLFLIWAKRKNIAKETVQSGSFLALLLVLLGVAIHCVGLIANATIVQSLAFTILFMTMPYYVWGGGVYRHLWGPLLYMTTMIPWPGQITSKILVPMQGISTTMASGILSGMGTHIYVDGTTVSTGNYTFEVAAACSGLTILFPTIAIAILTTMMVHGALWRKLLLVASAVPVSIVANSIRIALIGMIGDKGGVQLANTLHDSSGIVGVIIATVVLSGVGALLKVSHYYDDYMPEWARDPGPAAPVDAEADPEVLVGSK